MARGEKTGGETPPPEEATFEQNYARLEQIVRDLERGESTLEEAMARYEEGAGRLRACTVRLEEAEARIVALVEGEGGDLVEETIDLDGPTGGE
jgi:exodeoxyribonuclease VII small subunit